MIHKIRELLDGIGEPVAFEPDTARWGRAVLASEILALLKSEEEEQRAKLMERQAAFEARGWEYESKERVRMSYDINQGGMVFSRNISGPNTNEEHVVQVLLIRDGEASLYQKHLDVLEAIPHLHILIRDSLNPNYCAGYKGWPDKPEVLSVIESIKVDMARRHAEVEARTEVLRRIDALTKRFRGKEDQYALVFSPADETVVIRNGCNQHEKFGEFYGFKAYVIASLDRTAMWTHTRVAEYFAALETETPEF